MGTGKYKDVDFSTAGIVPWTPDTDLSSQGFKCNRGEFRSFWTGGRIRRDVGSHIGRCWVIVHENTLVAYITLLADKLTVEERILSDENIPYLTFPAVKIGLLAADGRARGAGKRLMEWALEYIALKISPLVGVRYATVDALYDPDARYDSSPFYRKMGFRFIQPDAQMQPSEPYRAMYIDLIDLIENP